MGGVDGLDSNRYLSMILTDSTCCFLGRFLFPKTLISTGCGVCPGTVGVTVKRLKPHLSNFVSLLKS